MTELVVATGICGFIIGAVFQPYPTTASSEDEP